MSQAQTYRQQNTYRTRERAGYNARPRTNRRRASESGLTARDRQHLLMMLVVAGLLGIIIIITTAFSATINYKNNQLQNDITVLEGEVEALEIEIQSANNIAAIEQKASKDLGMKYAEGNSYVVLSSEGNSKNDNFAAKLKNNAYGQ